MHNLKLLELKEDTEELRDLLKIINNEEKELSPEIEIDGKKIRYIMFKPELDGRIKIKSQT